MIPSQRNRQFMQMCWVVPDLEVSIDRWVRQAGAGPFFLFEDVHFEGGVYRGTPSDIAPHRAAIGQHGDMQIELIQPTADVPGIWSDVVPHGGFGFHHTALYCEDYEAEKQALLAGGAGMAFEGLMMGARTGYVDTVDSLGFMTELITANPIAAQVFAMFRDAAQGWNGADPIRSVA